MLCEVADGVMLRVRVQPGAKKTAIDGVCGDDDFAQLKVAVPAPPVEGPATEALTALLAETFNLPKRSVQLAKGESSLSKVFLLRGLTLRRVQASLRPYLV